MADTKKWLQRMMKHEAAVKRDVDIYADGIRTPSPSVNFIFGNTHLIPYGYSAILWGPPKGGKSILCNAIIGQLHKDDPEAIALKFNTEMRETGQLSERVAKEFGIDLDRYMAFDTNVPNEIFDYIETEVNEMCKDGARIRLIIIDSITDVAGRRALNADSVDVQQRGDEALTIQTGLKRIRSVLRKKGITLIMTAHERSEQDEHEIMRGKKTKMAGAYYLRHFAEYFIYVAPNKTVKGRTDFLGKKFENDEMTDLGDNAEKTGHKVIVKMDDSSVGVKGRTGEFTLDYYHGLINVHEEIFRLGVARKVIEKPNNVRYALQDWPTVGQKAEWHGKENCLTAIQQNEDLQKEIVKRIRQQDIELFKTGKVDPPMAPVEELEEAETSDD